ncbi:MAG: YadA-like family protein [Sulfurovaceae bacterium]|nr:YadA-like family protein [Sulfurovaceae bacterium]
MKKFTKFSLAAIAMLGLTSGAYAITNIDAGTGGTFTTTNTADTLTVTATGGTFVSNDVAVGGTIYGGSSLTGLNSLDLNSITGDTTLSGANDIILNVNNDGLTYGGFVVNDMGTTGGAVPLMSIYSNAQGGSDLYSTLNMNGNQIHGVAPGTLGTDAINLNQLNGTEKSLSKGIAATAALANIPQVDQGKTYSFGIGYGNYNSENAVALGGSWRFNNDGIFKASVGTGGSGETTVGAGAAWSW